MQVRSSELIGVEILSQSDGKKIGKIADIVLDKEKGVVQAIAVKKKSMLGDAQVIMWEDILKIDGAGVVVSSKDVIKPRTEAPQPVSDVLEDPKYVMNSKLKLADGMEVGKVEDVMIDTDTGKVARIEVKQGKQKLVVPVNKIVEVNKKETIVEESAPPSEPPNAPKRPEGIGQKIKTAITSAVGK